MFKNLSIAGNDISFDVRGKCRYFGIQEQWDLQNKTIKKINRKSVSEILSQDFKKNVFCCHTIRINEEAIFWRVCLQNVYELFRVFVELQQKYNFRFGRLALYIFAAEWKQLRTQLWIMMSLHAFRLLKWAITDKWLNIGYKTNRPCVYYDLAKNALIHNKKWNAWISFFNFLKQSRFPWYLSKNAVINPRSWELSEFKIKQSISIWIDLKQRDSFCLPLQPHVCSHCSNNFQKEKHLISFFLPFNCILVYW